MTRMHEALELLADHRRTREPDEILGAARARARRARARQQLAVGAVAAGLAVAVALATLVVGRDGAIVLDTAPAAPRPDPPPTSAPAAPAPGDARSTTVEVFFSVELDGSDCSATRAVTRQVEGPGVLRAALAELLRGPTADEQATGSTSWFSAETAGMLRSATIADGVAHVDLEDFSGIIPNASTSCGSAALMAQLDRTVTQFPSVQTAVYSFEGDVAAFYTWLQSEPPSEARPVVDPTWDGSVQVDLDDGTVTAPGFNDVVEAHRPGWAADEEELVGVLLHLDVYQHGEVVSVERRQVGEGRTVVTATVSNLMDDSVGAVRYEITLERGADDLFRFRSGTWSQRCQPGRGHEDFSTRPCV